MRTRPFLAVALAVVAANVRPGGASAQSTVFPPKPPRTVVDEGHLPGLVQVKFADGSGVRLEGDRFAVPRSAGADARRTVQAIQRVLRGRAAVARRMFAQTDAWLADWRAGGEARCGHPLTDFGLLYRIELPTGAPDAVARLCDELNRFGLVELAWPAPRGGDPVLLETTHDPAGIDGSITPSFAALQDYRKRAPLGIDAAYGNTFSGGRGEFTTIVDCETGWTDDHEDFPPALAGSFVGFTPAAYPWDHGTAVLGELVGVRNGLGVRGIAHEAQVLMSTHSPVGGMQNIPGAIMNGATVLGPGDALVIEIQCSGGFPGPYPCEADPAIYATVEAATANGVHVFAAGGNGSVDLDAPVFQGVFDLGVRDSGAVIVGASNGASPEAASFSNYGSRITSHGWGMNVVTTGFGNLHGTAPTNAYTSTFNGTSSATPIVTGAGILLAGIYREAFHDLIEPVALRTLLATTGTPQGAGGHIGTRPDVRRAVAALGVPRIEANLTPGILTIASHGEAGDPYALLRSSPEAVRTYIPGIGFLALDVDSLSVLHSGVLGPGGMAVDTFPLSLPFTPFVVQELQFVISGAGLSNVLTITPGS